MSDNLFRILVFYLMHAIFLGRIAKGTWQPKIGNNLMLLILQYFVKQFVCTIWYHTLQCIVLSNFY